ncbi:MAG: nucleotidyltransferase family protein [Verrucomicrobia bacterium]|nr:nucleotidyltransferase family protein [Verrucomicrobiota bacterium]
MNGVLEQRRLGVVILAAGASSRMGQPKLLLSWGGTSMLDHLLARWRALEPQQIAVVVAAGENPVTGELDRLNFSTANRIVNPNPERGMFSSIQCAARWNGWRSGPTHWAIVLGDQPLVRVETLRTVLDFAAAHPEKICQPSRNGRGRHPVLLPATAFRALADTPAATLKQFLSASTHSVALCDFDDPGLDLDIDRPEDYERAVGLAAEKT